MTVTTASLLVYLLAAFKHTVICCSFVSNLGFSFRNGAERQNGNFRSCQIDPGIINYTKNWPVLTV